MHWINLLYQGTRGEVLSGAPITDTCESRVASHWMVLDRDGYSKTTMTSPRGENHGCWSDLSGLGNRWRVGFVR